MTPFQQELHDLAFRLGERLNQIFSENFLQNWPDEESTTAALFTAMATLADETSPKGSGFKLAVKFSLKKDEARHGADVFIRFLCNEPEWRIDATTVIQAKRVEPSKSMSSGEHQRLTEQLKKMLGYTAESFVLLYSEQEGIQAVPALACQSLRSRQPFDVGTISWQWFLSGIFRGRMGESDQSRLPGKPRIIITITAEAKAAEPKAMTAGG